MGGGHLLVKQCPLAVCFKDGKHPAVRADLKHRITERCLKFRQDRTVCTFWHILPLTKQQMDRHIYIYISNITRER